MATIQKFLFEEDFDEESGGVPKPKAEAAPAAPAPPPSPPPPPPPPTFSVEELQKQVKMAKEQARTAALAEGRTQGKEEAEIGAQTALTTVLRGVDTGLKQLLSVQNAEMQARRDNTTRLVLAITRKLWPGLVERQGLTEIEGVIAAFLSELVEEPKLVFRVHEHWFDELRTRIEDMAMRHGFAGQVSVLADPKLGEMDVKVDWTAGGAERDVGKLWSDIEQLAGNLLADFPGGPGEMVTPPRREAAL